MRQDRELRQFAGAGAVACALLLAAIIGWAAAAPIAPCVKFTNKFQTAGICRP
jgi:hypothetical protein